MTRQTKRKYRLRGPEARSGEERLPGFSLRVAVALLGLACLWVPRGEAVAQHTANEVVPVEPFDAVHIERSHTIQLLSPPDQVFPLFTPEGRQRWSAFRPVMLRVPAEGWEGAVFHQPTIHAIPNTGVVTEYDPLRRRIRYLTFMPQSEAFEMEIQVGPLGEGSYATVTYRVTALSAAANDEVTAFFQGHFETQVDRWASAIDGHLAEGGT